jgi:hypothetical protein
MATKFGHTTADNYASFDKYWSFAMLGLSLGGAGVVAALPKTATKVALGNAQSVFHYAVDARLLTHARKALAGVKNATFGNFKVNFVTLPSARTLFNIEGVGRVVAPSWESLVRLRWRFIVDDGLEAAERSLKLDKGEAGIVSLRGGIKNPADANKLVEEAALAMGVSTKRLRKLIKGVELGETIGSTSAFTPRLTIRIRENIGTTLKGFGEYNEFRALTETMHEVRHAMRYHDRLKSGKSHRELFPNKETASYWEEEVLVETYAQKYMIKVAEPRVTDIKNHGNNEKAAELESLLRDAIFESNEYIRISQ